MKKKRVIPILILKDGWLVQSKLFREYKKIGNPIAGVKRFSDWDADELIYLDIDQGKNFGPNREDTASPKFSSGLDALAAISSAANMPITIGGGISSLKEIEDRLLSGADKIALNTQALINPKLIYEAAREFGSQCIVISVDYVNANGIATTHNKNLDSALLPTVEGWVSKVQDLGAGEILLTSMDRDGTRDGFDLELTSAVSNAVGVPVIASGGVGTLDHLVDGVVIGGADAVLAASIFHFDDHAIGDAKAHMIAAGVNVRP